MDSNRDDTPRAGRTDVQLEPADTAAARCSTTRRSARPAASLSTIWLRVCGRPYP